MSIAITLSFPESMINKIDQDRGDVNRSSDFYKKHTNQRIQKESSRINETASLF